jgi:hypothetical protein
MMTRLLFLLGLALMVSTLTRAQTPRYRTDAGNDQLPWYQLKVGEFPPPDAAHSLDISLVEIKPAARTGIYRTQERVVEQAAKMISYRLLPGATVLRHGAPADLRDFPTGSHVTIGAFMPPESDAFSDVWTLMDTFSMDTAAGTCWRIKALELTKGVMTLTPVKDGKEGKPKEVLIDARTTLWKGTGFAQKADLGVGQDVLVNFGPGTAHLPVLDLVTDVWLDEECRTVATARQASRAQLELRRRGLAAKIDVVDNKKSELSLTFFDPGLPGLLDRFISGKTCQLAAADTALRTAEPAGGQGGPDAMTAQITRHAQLPKVLGTGGHQIIVTLPYLLEGFRPGRNVRLVDDQHSFQILPPEDRVYE